eukprot:bmy_14287T0
METLGDALCAPGGAVGGRGRPRVSGPGAAEAGPDCLFSPLAESTAMVSPASSEAQVVQSLGFAIYRALDWGLAEHEERELSPQLERLIDLMANSDCDDDGGGGAADEGYGAPEEEEEAEGGPRVVRTFTQAMRLCAARLTEPRGAQTHYQAVCRALFVETLELRAFLARVREAKEMLQKLREDEPQSEKPLMELDSLGRTDWARLWVQLMRELRHGVKLRKVQEQEFSSLPTEFQLTPFEMLMQDIRARNYKLRKVMVNGDIPPRVKKDAHELILDFIRSRPPLKQVSERRLRPLPQKQRTLHEKILEEIKQERRLRPVEGRHWDGRGFGSLPCILNACSGDVKSSSCTNLSVTDAGSSAQRPRPRVLLKAPTLAEMEEMNVSEEFSHPVESLALTVEEVMDVRRVLVKAEMEKFLQNKELFSSLKKGKVRSPGLGQVRAGLGLASSGQNWALTRPFRTDLLLLPDQVPTVLLATHLSLLQESCLQFLQHKGEDHLGSERGLASQVSCGLTGPVRGWAEALLSPVG